MQYDDPKTIQGKKFIGKCRITYYTAHEDKYGARVADPNTRRAQQGVTVAAHPTFPFGTTIEIPELKSLNSTGIFVTQDRGGAVTRMKASHRTAYVWDVFLACGNKAMRAFQKMHPAYMDVWQVAKQQANDFAIPTNSKTHVAKN